MDPKLSQIEKRLSDIVKKMSEKGMVTPSTQLWISADAANTFYAQWRGGTEWKYGEGLDCLVEAEKWVIELPSIEEQNKNAFLKQLAKTIEMGRDFGIDANVVNPLEALIKDLSEGAITYQPASEGVKEEFLF